MVGPGTRPTLVQHHSSLLDVRRSQALCTGLPVPSSELARMAKEGCDSGRAGAAHDRAAGRARSGSAASAAGCLYTASATDCLSAPCATTSAAFHESSSGTSCRQGSCCDCWAAAGQQPGSSRAHNNPTMETTVRPATRGRAEVTTVVVGVEEGRTKVVDSRIKLSPRLLMARKLRRRLTPVCRLVCRHSSRETANDWWRWPATGLLV